MLNMKDALAPCPALWPEHPLHPLHPGTLPTLNYTLLSEKNAPPEGSRLISVSNSKIMTQGSCFCREMWSLSGAPVFDTPFIEVVGKLGPLYARAAYFLNGFNAHKWIRGNSPLNRLFIAFI